MLGLSRQSFYKQRGTQFRQLLKDDAIIKMVEKHREKMPKTGTVKLLNHYRQTWSSQGIFVGRDRLYTLLRKHQLIINKKSIIIIVLIYLTKLSIVCACFSFIISTCIT